MSQPHRPKPPHRNPRPSQPKRPAPATSPSLPTPETEAASADGERIQKVLARAGLASRREIEEWIKSGEILLNGNPAKLGERWKPGDRLTVRGRIVNVEQRVNQGTRVLIY
ncbi:MAG: S4 domain-containing protein, partial [Candidatus Methylumidiphilus sp.]